MPPFQLPEHWIIILDIAAWAFFHMLISILCLNIPLSFFLRDSNWFRIFAWEQSGAWWQQRLRIKRWKGHLLDGSTILRKGYRKKALQGTRQKDLSIFAAETKRAELTHWLSMVPAPLFFLWNPLWAGWVMILYALLFNLPFIVVQRYNRARIEQILAKTIKTED